MVMIRPEVKKAFHAPAATPTGKYRPAQTKHIPTGISEVFLVRIMLISQLKIILQRKCSNILPTMFNETFSSSHACVGECYSYTYWAYSYWLPNTLAKSPNTENVMLLEKDLREFFGFG
jgi:hypothetical protein